MKHLVIEYKSYLRNIARIYVLIFLFIISILTNSLITERIFADSNIYYVSTNGNNGNDGSFSSPWRTIEYAATQVTNGDTVNIMAGIYSPTDQIIIDNKNESNSWITFQNYNNDRVIIEGDNCPLTNAFTGVFQIHRSKYIRISGLTINHSAMCGISIWRLYAGKFAECSFIKVDNCTISNCSGSAFVILSGHNNLTFEHNYIYNNFNNWSGESHSQETISIQGLTTFSINNNTIINNCAENIDMKGGCNSGTVCYNTINNTGGYLNKISTIYYGGPAVMLDARGVSHNISIYNNKIYGNATGISLNTESTGHYEYIYVYNNIINLSKKGSVTSVTYPEPLMLSNSGLSEDTFHHIFIYSNTIHTGVTNNYATFQIGHYSINQLNSDNLQELYLINNIFVTDYTGSSSAITASFLSPDDDAIIFNNNSYYRASGTLKCRWDGTDYTNQTEWIFGDDAIFTDPQFVNRADENGDFQLQSNSPCIDAGSDLLVPNIDYNGYSRPQGSGFDIGAYEFLSTSDTNPPLISDTSISTSSPFDTNANYGWENISCSVTDDIDVNKVYITIFSPNDVENNLEMSKITGSDYYYYNLSLSDYGNYTYYIWANDTSDNTKSSDNFYLSLPPNWDVDNDGSCFVLDLILISNHYNEIGENGWIREDVDNNGIINILDMNLVSNNYGESWFT